MAEIVVLTAHPRLEHSRVNQALLQARRHAATVGDNPGTTP